MSCYRIARLWKLRIYWDGSEMVWGVQRADGYYDALYLGHLSFYWMKNVYAWKRPKEKT